jgi:uncharacterized membrane protein
MIKKNKWLIIITSAITIAPLIVGLLLWDKFPEQIATHFDMKGEANGWSGKGMAVMGLPLFMLATHWICVLATASDPKGKNVSGKVISLVLWICPIISVMVCGAIYSYALGFDFNMSVAVQVIIGLLFIIIGNYLPKCRQNYTIGIKVPWALNDEENWNHTHRFGGIIFVIGGIAMAVNAFWGNEVVLLAVIAFVTAVPIAYSYIYYRKHGE